MYVGVITIKAGPQPVVVSEKLNVVTDRSRRKLSVVTDEIIGKRSAVLIPLPIQNTHR